MRPIHPRFLLALLALLVAGGSWAGAVGWPAAGAGTKSGARARVLKTALESQRLETLRWEETTLRQAVAWLRVATGKNILFKERVLSAAGVDPAQLRYTLRLDDIAVGSLLRLLLEPHHLAIVYRDNVALVTTRADARGAMITRLYSIAHITWRKVDFPGPRMDLRPSEHFEEAEEEREIVREDDALSDPEEVVELLQRLVAPEGWERDGWTTRATRTWLSVRAPAAIHRLIPAALEAIAAMK